MCGKLHFFLIFGTVQIVISWFVSPALSGVVAIVIYTLIKFLILRARNPFKAGLISLPIIYGLSFFVNFLAITFGGSKCKFQFCITHDATQQPLSRRYFFIEQCLVWPT